MEDRTFIKTSDDVASVFTSEALEQADMDFLELFLSMFSEARRIAVEESSKAAKISINRSAWERGKWSVLTQRRRSGRYGVWMGVLRFVNILIPIAIGYGLSEVANRYWIVIAAITLLAVTFLVQERGEGRW